MSCVAVQVPIPLYFMTHAYFCFYHALSNVAIRVTRHATARFGPVVQHLSTAVTVFLLSYATAFMETLTIAHFPYYKFQVYRLGSYSCSRSSALLAWSGSQNVTQYRTTKRVAIPAQSFEMLGGTVNPTNSWHDKG